MQLHANRPPSGIQRSISFISGAWQAQSGIWPTVSASDVIACHKSVLCAFPFESKSRPQPHNVRERRRTGAVELLCVSGMLVFGTCQQCAKAGLNFSSTLRFNVFRNWLTK